MKPLYEYRFVKRARHRTIGRRLLVVFPMPGALGSKKDPFDEKSASQQWLFYPHGFRDTDGWGGGLIVFGLHLIAILVMKELVIIGLLGFHFRIARGHVPHEDSPVPL